MKLTTRILTTWVTAMVVAVLAPSAHAGIVTNGDFETGGLANWTSKLVTAPNTACGIAAASGTGLFGTTAAAFNCEGPDQASLRQTLQTTGGVAYDIEFWLKGGSGSTLQVHWGLVDLLLGDFSLGSTAVNGFQNYSVTQKAVGASTVLDFNFRFAGATSTAFLDNVSVDESVIGACPAGQACAVPEPGSLLLVGAALAAGAAASRKKKI